MADRPRYSHDQLEQFFDRIAIPEDFRRYSVVAFSRTDQHGYLNLLLKHTLVRIPFENLTLHYSWHRTINVQPQHLFNKIVRQPSRRGGYCMEVNSLFHTVLLSIGYDVFMTGARVYEKETGKYGGFSHCVNIVIIGSQRYMVDVGFGANGPTRPLRLGSEGAMKHIESDFAHIRLAHRPIPQQVDQTCKVWIYEHNINPDDGADWVPMYCFADFEFLLEDIRGMNLSPWKSRSSWFTQKIVLSRFTTIVETDGPDGPGYPSQKVVAEGHIDGALILFQDTLKWRRNGSIEFEVKFKNEAERIEAIGRYFGIELDQEDQEAIRGTISEIKSSRVLF
ncbi:arylamine N-acetyltransferase 3 [Hypoxylon fuscum]|nr:arylamine N-acetyltransferase 3 [Hypoxylon fuscum]